MNVTLVKPEALTWTDNPALPKGAQSVILLGDPTKAGEMVVTRIKLPANYRVPAHTHPMTETVTVLSGSVGFGMGEKFGDTKGEMLKAGGFFAPPANHAHYVWTGKEEAIVQVQYVGPGGIKYVNPRTTLGRSKAYTPNLTPRRFGSGFCGLGSIWLSLMISTQPASRAIPTQHSDD